MSRRTENTGFPCVNCGRMVQPNTAGSYRNHCPHCLCSVHLDEVPGDRASACGGLMEPVGVKYHTAKGWQLIHKCSKCGAQSVNRVDFDSEQADDLAQVLRLMRGSGELPGRRR